MYDDLTPEIIKNALNASKQKIHWLNTERKEKIEELLKQQKSIEEIANLLHNEKDGVDKKNVERSIYNYLVRRLKEIQLNKNNTLSKEVEEFEDEEF